MGYKIKNNTIKEEAEENLINKFNSFGLSISFDLEEDENEETVEDTTEETEKEEEI